SFRQRAHRGGPNYRSVLFPSFSNGKASMVPDVSDVSNPRKEVSFMMPSTAFCSDLSVISLAFCSTGGFTLVDLSYSSILSVMSSGRQPHSLSALKLSSQ